MTMMLLMMIMIMIEMTSLAVMARATGATRGPLMTEGVAGTQRRRMTGMLRVMVMGVMMMLQREWAVQNSTVSERSRTAPDDATRAERIEVRERGIVVAVPVVVAVQARVGVRVRVEAAVGVGLGIRAQRKIESGLARAVAVAGTRPMRPLGGRICGRS